MNLQAYFTSLSREIDALKDRVRNLIADRHWLTDGEWKESVIRHVLRRNLPSTVEVGRGFVVTEAGASRQLDVLIRDASKPVLFRDGDLAFVTPDAVLGIIEVKSRLTPRVFERSAAKLAIDIELVRVHAATDPFAALFAFEASRTTRAVLLDILARVVTSYNQRLDFVAAGDSTFVKYWHFDPADEQRMYESWHLYALPGLAAGYFVHNVIDSISPESVYRNSEVWFPPGGKEPHRVGQIQGRWAFRAG